MKVLVLIFISIGFAFLSIYDKFYSYLLYLFINNVNLDKSNAHALSIIIILSLQILLTEFIFNFSANLKIYKKLFNVFGLYSEKIIEFNSVYEDIMGKNLRECIYMSKNEMNCIVNIKTLYPIPICLFLSPPLRIRITGKGINKDMYFSSLSSGYYFFENDVCVFYIYRNIYEHDFSHGFAYLCFSDGGYRGRFIDLEGVGFGVVAGDKKSANKEVYHG